MPWTPEERKILIDHYQTHTCEQVAEMVNKKPNTVQCYANRYGFYFGRKIKEVPDYVVKEIRDLSKKDNMTQYSISEQTGISQSYVSRILSGKARNDKKTIAVETNNGHLLKTVFH